MGMFQSAGGGEGTRWGTHVMGEAVDGICVAVLAEFGDKLTWDRIKAHGGEPAKTSCSEKGTRAAHSVEAGMCNLQGI